MPVDLSPVDFLRLVDLGERRTLAKGEVLSAAGERQEEVYLIVEGTAEVNLSRCGFGFCLVTCPLFLVFAVFGLFCAFCVENILSCVRTRMRFVFLILCW